MHLPHGVIDFVLDERNRIQIKMMVYNRRDLDYLSLIL